MKYEVEGRYLKVMVPPELDHHVADEMRKELEELTAARGIVQIEFDFSETEFMDSSGIGVIIGRYRELSFRSGRVFLSHLNERLERIVRMSGLERIVTII